jgi:hypothetical protein
MGKKLTLKGLMARTRRYLRERGLRYANVVGGNNLLVLKASGDYHYLLIQFDALPEHWLEQQRYFNIKIASALNYEQLTNAIERYLV